jgi:polyisoprenoid-binding protein YceI
MEDSRVLDHNTTVPSDRPDRTGHRLDGDSRKESAGSVNLSTVGSGAYVIDPEHSHIGFSARALFTKVRGSFGKFDGVGYLDAENPANSKLTVTINAASIDTHNARRDAHLRSNAFFAVDAHPEIAFVSTHVEQTDTDRYRVAGDLTIKGITKRVTVDVRCTGAVVDSSGNHRVALTATTTVNRRDWGVSWNAILEGRGALMGNHVAVDLAAAAIRTDAGHA